MASQSVKKNLLFADRWELSKRRAALMKKCLTDSFEELHREICMSSEIDWRQSGSTLTVIIVE
jgi:hypothetical protein